MKKMLMLTIISVLMQGVAMAADRDLDGVPDDRDRCRHTPFWALVNAKGCTIRQIRSVTRKRHHRH